MSNDGWRLKRNAPSTPELDLTLRQFARNVKSQGGEDGILERLFQDWWPDIVESPSRHRPRYIVEIGAWDGEHLSNSWNLIKQHNWTGLLVEVFLHELVYLFIIVKLLLYRVMFLVPSNVRKLIARARTSK